MSELTKPRKMHGEREALADAVPPRAESAASAEIAARRAALEELARLGQDSRTWASATKNNGLQTMRHGQFKIGETFRCGGQQWRRTDIGTRTIVAICLDRVEVGSPSPELRRTLGRAEAEAEGWFNGPPYAVLEHVFDEGGIVGCSLTPDDDATREAEFPA